MVHPSLDEMSMVRRVVCSTQRLLLKGIILLLSVSACGCGIKGPPVPPRPPPVPEVVDLDYQLAGPTVTLTWRLPVLLSVQQAHRSAFSIYRSRTPLAEPACDGCPLVFESVARVPYVHGDTHRYSSVVSLDSGYRYVFKVRLDTGSGAGADSNPVQFELLPGGPSGGSKIP